MSVRIEFDRPGGPDVLRPKTADVAEPGPNQVRVRQTIVGANYVDIYHRSGLYPLPAPAVPGVEAVGVVDAVGPGVSGVTVGDRVGYATLPAGSYADMRVLAADRLLRLPDDISNRQAAGSLLRGLTAHLLLKVVGNVQPGQTLLIHAAAGGLGLILTQWAKRLGLRTIGTVGSPEKAELASSLGLDHAMLYKEMDFGAAVLSLTGGRGVDFAVDGIGGAVLDRTLDVLKPLGIIANIGQVAGNTPPVEVTRLTNRFLIRASILGHVVDRASYEAAASDWFSVLREGLDTSAGCDYPLSDAGRAHADMEQGKTSGSVRLWI